MREGSKKTFKKQNIEPIFGKGNEGDEMKKNIGHISGKVNEGDEKNKPNSWNFFYVPKLTVFFSEMGNNPMRAPSEKKTYLFW